METTLGLLYTADVPLDFFFFSTVSSSAAITPHRAGGVSLGAPTPSTTPRLVPDRVPRSLQSDLVLNRWPGNLFMCLSAHLCSRNGTLQCFTVPFAGALAEAASGPGPFHVINDF
jgi:hypothetical protein